MADTYASQLRRSLMEQYQRARGENQYLAQAGQQYRAQAPAILGQAERFISQRLSPGYSAFNPAEGDARYRLLQARISRNYDQALQDLREDANRRNLYHTGLYDELRRRYVSEPRAQALNEAALSTYLAGQEATRQAQAQALQAALGLGGQQAGLNQQTFQNLLQLAGLQQQASLLPLQLGMQLYQGIYGPYEQQEIERQMQQQQSLWSNVLQGLSILAGFFL